MQEVRTFIHEATSAFNSKDRDGITQLIALEEADPRLAKLQEALYKMTEEAIRSTVQNDMKNGPRPLKDFITNYLLFSISSALVTSSMVDVYEQLSTCYGNFLSLYAASDAQWLTPLLINLSSSLVTWAVYADEEKPKAKELKISDAAAKHLSKAFNIVISDKVPNALKDSKKMALYYLANLTFRVYFKLRSTRLIPTMIANISKAGVDLSSYPMSQQVTHRYYLGRYYLYQLDLRRAERELAFAFRNSPDFGDDESDNGIIYNNSRLILIYLTSCRLCLGRMPAMQLLEAYNLLPFFAPLMTAVKLGNLALLDQTLSSPDFMMWFVKKEIFFLLKEKLTVLCWRSLIRRVWLASQHPPEPPQLRVQLEVLFNVVLELIKDSTYDIYNIFDIECITASLLDQGYIKGYIHSQKKILVLSKTNPFPIVYTVEVMEEVL
ncbi:hypothetical protein BC939DRAFT_152412 [Gamsiella multidivaricata]|uniref:uncharacterized protein n=1 Tax=Gamsiella multidivaricata TaxID=101098 RepID=UPI00221EBCBD|nr:uncharacterized protein BC939DRAFT_152412 [Gamsiella multidivaricata]KAI7824063.1 hypothetical protein BC939DRAFT_152412 [Gamsiella multidivaricata]